MSTANHLPDKLCEQLCEIRVPTYRRPNLLRRALQSVCDQTHTNWICCIFDDCPDRSAESIVAEFAEPRFRYLPNPRQRKAIGNIDYCFRNSPFAHGQFACVLEDDNYLLPDALQRQLATCQQVGVDLLISAQYCENVVEKDVPGELLDVKTLVWIYKEGRYQPESLYATLMFSHAFSNGSVFWKLAGGNDLEVGMITARPGIQESLRILKIHTDVYVSHEPAAVWRWNSEIDSSVSLQARTLWQKLAKRLDGIFEAREALDYRYYYLSRYGRKTIDTLANSLYRDHVDVIENALLKSGYYSNITNRSDFWRVTQLLKWTIFRMFVPKRLNFSRFHSPPLASNSARALPRQTHSQGQSNAWLLLIPILAL